MHCRHSVLGDSGRQVGGKWDASVKSCSLLHPGRQQCTRRQWETSETSDKRERSVNHAAQSTQSVLGESIRPGTHGQRQKQNIANRTA